MKENIDNLTVSDWIEIYEHLRDDDELNWRGLENLEELKKDIKNKMEK